MAVKILRKIKSLMKKNGNEEEWKKQFGNLKDKHKRKKNFMMLLGNV